MLFELTLLPEQNNLDYFLREFKNANIEKLDYIFAECSSLTSIDISNLNTSNVTSFKYMFHSCFALTSINLTNFETINAENMEGMFYHCSKLVFINLGSFPFISIIKLVKLYPLPNPNTKYPLLNSVKQTNSPQ